MVKIYHTNFPVFVRNGKTESVDTRMFRDFSGFDKFLEEKNPEEVYFFNATNMYGNEIITTIPPKIPILLIRYKLFKDETISFGYPQDLMEKPLSEFLQ